MVTMEYEAKRRADIILKRYTDTTTMVIEMLLNLGMEFDEIDCRMSHMLDSTLDNMLQYDD